MAALRPPFEHRGPLQLASLALVHAEAAAERKSANAEMPYDAKGGNKTRLSTSWELEIFMVWC